MIVHSGESLNINVGPLLSLNGELVSIVGDFVRRFAEVFSEIRVMGLVAGPLDNTPRQLSSMLVNIFSDKLCGLEATDVYGEDLINFPQDLTTLRVECNGCSFPALPCANSLPLEKLYIYAISDDFSWSHFQQNPGSNDPVAFSNLKNIVLGSTGSNKHCLVYAQSRGVNFTAPVAQVRVQPLPPSPQLKKLMYYNVDSGLFVSA